MRKLILFILLCRCFGCLFARQAITKEENAPRQGDILHRQKIEYINPGDSGVNNLWDLRNIVIIDGDYETFYYDGLRRLLYIRNQNSQLLEFFTRKGPCKSL